MDKAFLQQIASTDFAVPQGYTATDLLPELLSLLGSTDMEIRDSLVYTTLVQWIVRDERFSPAQLRSIRDQLVANMQVGLGEQGTPTVLLRSFSVLILSIIIYYDVQKPFLTDVELKTLLDQVLGYFAAEKDLRGYTTEYGWAHSTAHTADLFKFIARDPKSTLDDHQRILTAIVEKLLWPLPYIYVHGEDERLVSTLVDIFKRGLLPVEVWNGSLDKFAAWKQSWQMTEFNPAQYAPWLNAKTFLRSLYFRIEQTPELPLPAVLLKPKLLDVIKQFGQ